MSSNTRLAGLPVAFEWEGRSYPLGHRDFNLELAFQSHMEERAARKIEQHRGTLGEAWYQNQLAIWQRNCTANAYEMETAETYAYLWTKEGSGEYAWLKLQKGKADARERKERCDSFPSKGDFMELWHENADFRKALWGKVGRMEGWIEEAVAPKANEAGEEGAEKNAPEGPAEVPSAPAA